MNIYNRNILIVLWLGCLILVMGLGIANAAPLTATGSTNTIPVITISSGGSNNLQNTTYNYKVIDIKGQAVVGFMTNSSYNFGLGGIYGEVVKIEVPTTEVIPPATTESIGLTDNGLIRGTVIERVADAPGSGIRIKFRSRDAGISQANIYKLTGIATSFTTATADWALVESNYPITAPGSDTLTVWTDPAIRVADANNAYYRVVPSIVTDKTQIFGMDSSRTPYNERTVGKVDLYIQRKADAINYNTFSVNLLPQGGNAMDLVFPANSFIGVNPSLNKLDADQIREWDGANWLAYFKSSTGGSWKLVSDGTTAASYKFNRGYMIRLQRKPSADPANYFYLTTVGQVLPITYVSNADYGTPPIGTLGGALKYTAFGNPFPKNASFNDAFATNVATGELTLAPGPNKLQADQIRYWEAVSGNWLSCYLASDGNWKLNTSEVSAFNLMIGTGYMFRKADGSTKGEFIWKY